MSALLEQLARRQLIWQGNNQQAAYQAVSSGFAELEQKLAGGFPATGLIDIQTEYAIGELRLLLPYLVQQQSQGRLLVLIAPPAQPCADMFSTMFAKWLLCFGITVAANHDAGAGAAFTIGGRAGRGQFAAVAPGACWLEPAGEFKRETAASSGGGAVECHQTQRWLGNGALCGKYAKPLAAVVFKSCDFSVRQAPGRLVWPYICIYSFRLYCLTAWVAMNPGCRWLL